MHKVIAEGLLDKWMVKRQTACGGRDENKLLMQDEGWRLKNQQGIGIT